MTKLQTIFDSVLDTTLQGMIGKNLKQDTRESIAREVLLSEQDLVKPGGAIHDMVQKVWSSEDPDDYWNEDDWSDMVTNWLKGDPNESVELYDELMRIGDLAVRKSVDIDRAKKRQIQKVGNRIKYKKEHRNHE